MTKNKKIIYYLNIKKMKIIMGVLGVIILGMVVAIVSGMGDDKSMVMPTNVVINETQPIETQKAAGGMVIDEEMCNRMPGMKGCKEFLEQNKKVVKSSSSLVVLNNNQKLGEIPMDEGKIDIVFEIQNTGTEDIILGEANGSCFCTQGYVTNEDGSNKSVEFNTIGAKYPTDINRVIKAGEKQIVTAIYDPEAHGPNEVGPTTRGLTIKTNSASTPNIRLDFFGTVVKTRSK